jgi:KaiC/GvpD/RAD55 family RecA-like ATPase
MPGSVVVVCGDPGVGKTYLLLDCLRYWTANDVDASVFFLEEDRKFYLRRLLAQQEGDARYTQLAWWKEHPDQVRAAMARQREAIDTLGARITVAGERGRVDLGKLTAWLHDELRSGRRVVAIDPITAAYAGADRWLADDVFLMETKALVSRYNASLVLVTHPRKGNVTLKSGHDMAAGAAYFRFSSTALWINRTAKPKRYHVATLHGPSTCDTDTTVQIHKAREGKARGQEIAMSFGDGLHFAEHGIVTGESDEEPEDTNGPARPATPGQAERARKHLTGLYPMQITQDQAKFLDREFSRYPLATVDRAIESHRQNNPRLDIDKLLEQLRSLT